MIKSPDYMAVMTSAPFWHTHIPGVYSLKGEFVYKQYHEDELTENKFKCWNSISWNHNNHQNIFFVNAKAKVTSLLNEYKYWKDKNKTPKKASFEALVNKNNNLFEQFGLLYDGHVHLTSLFADFDKHEFKTFIEEDGNIVNIKYDKDIKFINKEIKKRLNDNKDKLRPPDKVTYELEKFTEPKKAKFDKNKFSQLSNWFDWSNLKTILMMKITLSENVLKVIEENLFSQFEYLDAPSLDLNSGFISYAVLKYKNNVLEDYFFQWANQLTDLNILYGNEYKYEVYALYGLVINQKLIIFASGPQTIILSATENKPPSKIQDLRLYPLDNNQFLLTWGHPISYTKNIRSVNINVNSSALTLKQDCLLGTTNINNIASAIDISNQFKFNFPYKVNFKITVTITDTHGNISASASIEYDNKNKKFIATFKPLNDISPEYFKELLNKNSIVINYLNPGLIFNGFIKLINISQGGKITSIPINCELKS